VTSNELSRAFEPFAALSHFHDRIGPQAVKVDSHDGTIRPLFFRPDFTRFGKGNIVRRADSTRVLDFWLLASQLTPPRKRSRM
jgi:hypothetical protein